MSKNRPSDSSWWGLMSVLAGILMIVELYDYFANGCAVLSPPINRVCGEPNAFGTFALAELILGLIVGSYMYGKWKSGKETDKNQ